MKRKNTMWSILYLIFLVVFNLIFYTLGGINHPASVWISYFFIHFAYLFLLATPFFVRKGRETGTFSAVLGWISATYFGIELVVGILFILIPPKGIKGALIVQVLILAVYLFVLISNMIANEQTETAIERHSKDLCYVKTASVRMRSIMEKVGDRVLLKKIEKVYDVLRCSPVKSSSAAKEIEQRVFKELDSLERAVSMGDEEGINTSAETLYALVVERNHRLI